MTWPPPPPSLPSERAARRRTWWRVPILVVATTLGVAAVVGLFVFRPRVLRVEGHAMSPTLRNDDRLISLRVLDPVARGDIVGFRYPKNPAKSFVKRVVGLPGEELTIADGVVRIGGQPLPELYVIDANRSHETFGPVRLGADEYFVLGDNRRNSSDSREWGPVARDLIWCRVRWRWWRGDTFAR